jgi:AcrR family transcriptional regulator
VLSTPCPAYAGRALLRKHSLARHVTAKRRRSPARPSLDTKLAPANHDRNRPRPLVAALAVLRRDGPGALTLRAVAEEGGFSNPAIYKHYENKDALIREIIRETYGVFKSYVFDTIDVDGDRRRLDAALDAVVRFALEHPRYYELLFFTPHRLVIDRYPDDFRQGRSPAFRYLADLVAACMRSGDLRKGDATDTAITLVAHLHGLVILHQTGRFNDDDTLFRAFVARSMAVLMRGLAKTPGHRP